jgi:DNA-binding NarL/FixJ family response regulator
MIKVLVVDDQPILRSGLTTIIEAAQDIVVVGEAGDGEGAVTLATQLMPDVVLMDIRMPGMNGIDATRALTAMPEPPRVVILTAYDPDRYVFEGLAAGASGFLLKTDDPARFIDAIRAAYTGDGLFSAPVTRRLVERYVATPPANRVADTPSGLTPREADVLLLLSQGLSNAEIGERLFIGEGTVKSHVAHLLTKLGLRDRVHAVVFAYETGLVRPHGRQA